MKRIINKRKTYHYSPRVIHQAVFPSIYISLIEVITSIFTTVSLQYLFSCLPFDFLESYSLILFSEEMLVIFFYLASTTWKVSVPFKRVIFLAKTLSQSFFRYSNYFLFSFSFTSLYFLVFFYTLALATFLAFCAAHSIWPASAISSRWTQSFCSSLYYCCIFWHCCSSIFALV